MKRILLFTISVITIFNLAILVNGCSQENPMPLSQNQIEDDGLLLKRSMTSVENVAIQSASGTVYYKESLNHYAGMGFGHPSGSSFILQPESLTPPREISWGDPVTITMTVEKDLANGTLIYTFAPSGSSFEPAATLWISWSDLGTETANLYYIQKNGRYVSETPDQIDYEGKKFKVLIDHFSRYAVAYSD